MSQNPQGPSLPYCSLHPATAAGLSPPGCGTLAMSQDSLLLSPTFALVLYTWLSPAKVKRTCGQAGSTPAGELCHWGDDRLGIPKMLSSFHLSRQQNCSKSPMRINEREQWNVRRDGSEGMKEPGHSSALCPQERWCGQSRQRFKGHMKYSWQAP